MSNEFALDVELRQDVGKGASRRLRRLAQQVPAVIYGGDKDATSIMLEHRHIIKALENPAFYSHILTLNVAGGDKEKVLLKDLQRHPYKPSVMHVDFQRVSAKDIITRHVHLNFINDDQAPGVKAGGVVTHQMKDVEIKCSALNLPEHIEVDLADLEMDAVLHLSDLKLPEGVSLTALDLDAEHDLPVVSVHMPRAVVEEEEEAEQAPEGEAPTEGEAAEGESEEGSE